MPRDSSGNYTLPAGINPVVSNTLIDVDWANPTLNDIATQLNNVLTRDGLLGPVVPFKVQDGTETLPGLAFNSQSNTGLFRPTATNALGFSVLGVEIGRFATTGLTVTGALITTGNTVLGDAATDTLNVGNGGIVKDASGNVGIGQMPSGGKLCVTSSAGVNAFKSTNGTVNFFAGGGDGSTFVALGTDSNVPLTVHTNALERMRIDASGNVGIGQTPSSGKLCVTSSASNTALVTTNGSVNFFAGGGDGTSSTVLGTYSNVPLVIYTSGTERMRIDTSGGVTIAELAGIGTRNVGVDSTGRLVIIP